MSAVQASAVNRHRRNGLLFGENKIKLGCRECGLYTGVCDVVGCRECGLYTGV